MSSPRTFWSIVLSIFLAVALCCTAAWAQGPAEANLTGEPAAAAPTASPLPDSPQQQAASSDDSWHFDLAPYVWIPGINGTAGALGHVTSVHVTGSDVLSNFNGGLAGYFEARKNRFVMPIDFIWARVGTTQGIPLNDLDQTSIRALFSQVIFTPKVGYRIADTEHLKVDALVGLRYWHEGVTLTPRPANVSYSQSANWVDAVAGGKFTFLFTPKVWITAAGDAGGGQANLDYQVAGTLNFQPKPMFGFFVGWRYLDVNYSAGLAGFQYDVAQSGPLFGLNMQLGGKPPVPPTASCSVAPTEIWAGDPVTATISTQNFNPKHTITYQWTSTGGKISGTGTTGNVDTTGLAPGNYTVGGTATDAKEKKNNVASCNATFTVRQPHPPQASCSANPDTVKAGDGSTVTVNAGSPDNFPLSYSWTASAGRISGTGTTAMLDTTGAPPGSPITATATVTDSRGLSTTCNATVNVLAPPVTISEVSEVGECQFMDAKRPWRVDNTCKAVLDDVALRIQREPNGKFVVVGYADEQESVTMSQLGGQRAVNVKYYLTEGEGKSGIDASRLEPRTGVTKSKSVKIYFVPSGTTFTEESTVVDETQVKGQARNAPAPKKKTKKAAATQGAPAQ